MKSTKLLIVSAFLAAPMFASADPGCGLGAQVFDGKTGVVSHVLAATTNGTSGNQTFGMTSGTLGCDTSKPVVAAAVFINENMDEVAESMALGQGEALTTLAELLEVKETETFAALMQENFDVIYASETATAEDVITNIEAVLNAAS